MDTGEITVGSLKSEPIDGLEWSFRWTRERKNATVVIVAPRPPKNNAQKTGIRMARKSAGCGRAIAEQKETP